MPQYVAGLFPKLNSQEISAAVVHYAGLGLAPIDQAVAIMGEGVYSILSSHACAEIESPQPSLSAQHIISFAPSREVHSR